jgi:hypothetical protein
MNIPVTPVLTCLALPAWECATIVDIASAHGVDPRMLAAIRHAEQGGPGKEFGVLSAPASTYQDQATIAANTIRHTMSRFLLGTAHPLVDPLTGSLTPEFLFYFSRGGPGYPGYAPFGAANDPKGLNAHHLANLEDGYLHAALTA